MNGADRFNNGLVSDILSKQIPRPRAANAFNIFREAMHQIEVVRLCALWDAVTIDRESIPTAVELVDDEAVIELILERTRAEYATVPNGKNAWADRAPAGALAARRDVVRSLRADGKIAMPIMNQLQMLRDTSLRPEAAKRETKVPPPIRDVLNVIPADKLTTAILDDLSNP
jgi:hypothetical protein